MEREGMWNSREIAMNDSVMETDKEVSNAF